MHALACCRESGEDNHLEEKMAKDWIPGWNASTKPGKQRKYRYNAPRHVLRKFLSAHLASPLRKKYQKRSFPIRVGDKVKVLRGQFKGTSGKISRVDIKNSMVFVDGAEFTKKDGTKIVRPIHASNVQITDLDLGDKLRVGALKRGTQEKKE